MKSSIKENTELIAEFMGIVYNKDEHIYYNNNNGYKIQSTILDFYSSWDWLMPVVQKIKEVNGYYPQELNNVSLFSEKREVFKAVAKFIKQYNKNK